MISQVPLASVRVVIMTLSDTLGAQNATVLVKVALVPELVTVVPALTDTTLMDPNVPLVTPPAAHAMALEVTTVTPVIQAVIGITGDANLHAIPLLLKTLLRTFRPAECHAVLINFIT